MKRWLIYFILLLQCFFAACATAAPQIPPKPTAAAGIYVQDYAQVLSAEDKRRLLSIGQELDDKTTAQLAVVTVKTLDGQPIEDYALSILREWGIGSNEKNNGALIVVAVQDRRSRIEVGYGLEGLLTDGLTGRIQDQTITTTEELNAVKNQYKAGDTITLTYVRAGETKKVDVILAEVQQSENN
jgi:uncharacterized protein